MDNLFIIDLGNIDSFDSDKEIIKYVCNNYANRNLDKVLYSSEIPTEKELKIQGRNYKVIFISNIERTRKFLKDVYNVAMLPIELPVELQRYNPTYKQMWGKDIPEEYKNGEYFIKCIDELKSWNNLLIDGNCSEYIKDKSRYAISNRYDILSEWRVFVDEKEVEAVENYSGSPVVFPDSNVIKSLLQNYTINVPRAFTLDIAIIKKGVEEYTTPLEVHPFVSCGLYGYCDQKLLNMWAKGQQWYIDQRFKN